MSTWDLGTLTLSNFRFDFLQFLPDLRCTDGTVTTFFLATNLMVILGVDWVSCFVHPLFLLVRFSKPPSASPPPPSSTDVSFGDSWLWICWTEPESFWESCEPVLSIKGDTGRDRLWRILFDDFAETRLPETERVQLQLNYIHSNVVNIIKWLIPDYSDYQAETEIISRLSFKLTMPTLFILECLKWCPVVQDCDIF